MGGGRKKLNERVELGCHSRDKNDFAMALRAHHVAVKAMKSPQKEAEAKPGSMRGNHDKY